MVRGLTEENLNIDTTFTSVGGVRECLKIALTTQAPERKRALGQRTERVSLGFMKTHSQNGYLIFFGP